jgi:hypothetical protein
MKITPTERRGGEKTEESEWSLRDV